MGYNQHNKKDLYQNYQVDHFQFFQVKTIEVAYILGLIWADGYLGNDNRSIFISCKYDNDINSDFNIIKKILEKSGNWKNYKYKRYDKRTNKIYHSGIFMASNKYIFNFLVEMDYDKKSYISPIKILNHIPVKLQHHFIRGYSDGDGSYYQKNNIVQYCITSSINQNWEYIINLFNELNIEKLSILKQENKKGKGSKIRIVNKWDNIKFSDYLYKDSENVRFDRKYNMYLKIKDYNIKKSAPKWTDNEINFIKDNYNNKGIKYCAKKIKKNIWISLY